MQPVGAMAAATERYQKARITWRRDHAPDLWSIRIRPEQKLLFKPGQYATIGVERDGRVIERPDAWTSVMGNSQAVVSGSPL